MFKIPARIWIIATVGSEGQRNQKRRLTIIYYQLPWKTIFSKLWFASHRKAYFMQFGLVWGGFKMSWDLTRLNGYTVYILYCTCQGFQLIQKTAANDRPLTLDYRNQHVSVKSVEYHFNSISSTRLCIHWNSSIVHWQSQVSVTTIVTTRLFP